MTSGQRWVCGIYTGLSRERTLQAGGQAGQRGEEQPEPQVLWDKAVDGGQKEHFGQQFEGLTRGVTGSDHMRRGCPAAVLKIDHCE